LVVRDLDRAPPVGLVERLLDRLGLLVGVHEHAAVDVARGAPDRLDERRAAAQEALLVGVEDRDQRDLRQVEALAEQVDADEPGVADTNTSCGTLARNSSKRSGRLSSADGRRKPKSTRVCLRERSPSYIPPICGTVWCDSSTKTTKSEGK